MKTVDGTALAQATRKEKAEADTDTPTNKHLGNIHNAKVKARINIQH